MFLSPRHPSYYPDRTVCNYKFIGLVNEQVRITFESFEVENGGTKYVFELNVSVESAADNTLSVDADVVDLYTIN